MAGRTYSETFDEDAGGWTGWASNFKGFRPLETAPGAVTSRSPWWIDYNHAPPGAGYMHMVATLDTTAVQGEAARDLAGRNRFVAGGFPADFTNARITVRLKGELLSRGADLMLLIQGHVDGLCSGWLLTSRPITVREQWSDATLHLPPAPSEWTALGSRHDRTDMYGERPLPAVLSHVSMNFMFVLYPLTVEPMGPIDGDPHRLRAGHDYPVWRSRLPEGYVTFDSVEVAFA